MQNPLSLLFGAGPVDYAQLPHGIACSSESVHMHYCIILPSAYHTTIMLSGVLFTGDSSIALSMFNH